MPLYIPNIPRNKIGISKTSKMIRELRSATLKESDQCDEVSLSMCDDGDVAFIIESHLEASLTEVCDTLHPFMSQNVLSMYVLFENELSPFVLSHYVC